MVEWTHTKTETVNKVFDEISHDITLKIAMMITAKAKALAPLNKNKNAGRLRNSIMWKVGSKQGGFNEDGGQAADKELTVQPEKDSDGYVGLNLDYGVYQEFGTRYMSPQPYLRPAIALVITDKTKDEIKNMIDAEHKLGKLEENQVREAFY